MHILQNDNFYCHKYEHCVNKKLFYQSVRCEKYLGRCRKGGKLHGGKHRRIAAGVGYCYYDSRLEGGQCDILCHNIGCVAQVAAQCYLFRLSVGKGRGKFKSVFLCVQRFASEEIAICVSFHQHGQAGADKSV